MDYDEIEPPHNISSFVKCIWKYGNKGRDIQHTIFPNGCFELFMIFYRQNLVSVFMSGLRTESFEVYVPKGVVVLGVRFKLSASEYVFRSEIRSILNSNKSLELNFWKLKELEHLPFDKQAAILINKISAMTDGIETDAKKLLLLETVYTPDLAIGAITEITMWNRRKINRYFSRQFGLSLKTFLNIIRLRASFPAIKKGNLFPELNYYDQSHYIKGFKKYTGRLPKQLQKNEDDRFLQFSVNEEP